MSLWPGLPKHHGKWFLNNLTTIWKHLLQNKNKFLYETFNQRSRKKGGQSSGIMGRVNVDSSTLIPDTEIFWGNLRLYITSSLPHFSWMGGTQLLTLIFTPDSMLKDNSWQALENMYYINDILQINHVQKKYPIHYAIICPPNFSTFLLKGLIMSIYIYCKSWTSMSMFLQ